MIYFLDGGPLDGQRIDITGEAPTRMDASGDPYALGPLGETYYLREASDTFTWTSRRDDSGKSRDLWIDAPR